MDITIKGQHIFVVMQALYLDWLVSKIYVCDEMTETTTILPISRSWLVTIMESWEPEIQLCGPVFSPACTRPCISLQHPVGGSRKGKEGENDSEGNRRTVSLSRLLKLG